MSNQTETVTTPFMTWWKANTEKFPTYEMARDEYQRLQDLAELREMRAWRRKVGIA